MTIKTALRGTMIFGAACLLAGNGARAEEAVSTGPATTPSNSDYQLHQPAPAQNPAGMSDRPLSDRQMNDRPMSDRQASTGNVQDDSAPVSVAGRVDKFDRANDMIEIDGVDRQLKLDPNTRVTRNGSRASLSDLQEGEQVRASFDDGLPARVRQLDIMSPSSAGPSSVPADPGTATSTGPASPSDMSDRANTAPDSGTTATQPDSRLLPRRDAPATTR